MGYKKYANSISSNLCYNSVLMILVTGGTGFIGQSLIRHLVEGGKPVRTLLRPSQKSPHLPRGVSIEVAVSSLRDERGLRAALKDIDTVIHLAGGERYGSRSSLEAVDVEGSKVLAQACKQAGVRRIVFLSHLGADRASAYPVFKAKAIAEHFFLNSGVSTTIVRSAVAFGPNDQFTTSFLKLIRLSPFIFFIPGDGHNLLQPIWVEDLTTCMQMIVDDDETAGQIFSIGGGEYLTLHEVLDEIMATARIKRRIVPMSPIFLRGLSVWFEQGLPWFPISVYWLDYLATDRTCALDTLPRRFGLIPARFRQQLDYLRPRQHHNLNPFLKKR